MFIWIYETLEMIEKSQKKGEYTYKITKAKKCEFTIAWKIKIR